MFSVEPFSWAGPSVCCPINGMVAMGHARLTWSLCHSTHGALVLSHELLLPGSHNRQHKEETRAIGDTLRSRAGTPELVHPRAQTAVSRACPSDTEAQERMRLSVK